MEMQLLEIKTYISERFISILEAEGILQHINEIYLDITRPFTLDITKEAEIETVAEEKVITLALDSRNIKYIRGLRHVDRRAIVYPQGAGKPKRWNVLESNTKVLLDPIPDDVYLYTVEYEPLPVKLALDADIPLYIPSEYHHLIAWGTIAILASIQEDFKASDTWEARYRDGINNMLTHLGISAPENYPNLSLAVVNNAKTTS